MNDTLSPYDEFLDALDQVVAEKDDEIVIPPEELALRRIKHGQRCFIVAQSEDTVSGDNDEQL